jgi:sulfide dehydrogenase cytochrome subunit
MPPAYDPDDKIQQFQLLSVAGSAYIIKMVAAENTDTFWRSCPICAHSLNLAGSNMKRKNSTLTVVCLGALLFGPAFVGASAADVAKLAAACDDCHGKDGASTEPKIPSIGGMSAAYITDSLAVYQDKSRPCADVKYPAGAKKGQTANMCDLAGKLGKGEDELLAEHYAGKPFVPAKQAFDAGLAKRGKGIHEVECKKCHEDGGSSPDDDAGILAGQWVPYLESQFDEFMSGKRPMTKKMQPKMEKLTPDDIKALIQFYASQQ